MENRFFSKNINDNLENLWYNICRKKKTPANKPEQKNKGENEMKTTVTHTCGHKEDIAVFGKRADREKKIAWLESQPCAECRAAESAEASKAAGMAALVGSPRQIAWAEDLRTESINAVQKIEARTETEAVHKDRLIKYLGSITSAAWWIENHGCAGSRMIISRAIKYAAEHGIDLTAEEETVEAAETDEPVE